MNTGRIITTTKITALTAVTGILMAASFDAHATLINLTSPYNASAYEVNNYPPGPTAANLYSRLTTAISAYNTSHPSANVPSAGAIDLTPQLFGGATTDGTGKAAVTAGGLSYTINFAVEHEGYLALNWDGPNGGTQFYYVGGETGSDTFVSPVFTDGLQHGLSGYMFTAAAAVPEPTTVVAGLLLLLPFGASTLRFVRKHRMA